MLVSTHYVFVAKLQSSLMNVNTWTAKLAPRVGDMDVTQHSYSVRYER